MTDETGGTDNMDDSPSVIGLDIGDMPQPIDFLLAAAQSVLEAVDDKLDNATAPLKWTVPWARLTALRTAVLRFRKDEGAIVKSLRAELQQLRAERPTQARYFEMEQAKNHYAAELRHATARIAALEAELERANDLKAAAETNWSNEVLDLGEKIDAQTAALEARDRLIDEVMKWRSRAASDVLSERSRQVNAEGWTNEHDDGLLHGEMATAAACYALNAAGVLFPTGSMPPFWKWAVGWWKPKSPRQDLVRAAALLVAEIERLDRDDDRRTQNSEINAETFARAAAMQRGG